MYETEMTVPSNLPESDADAKRISTSRDRWRRLGLAIRGTTPSDLAHLVLIVLAFAGVGWLIWNTWLALIPFQVGLVLAYVVLPAVNGLDRVMPRSWAVVLVLLAGLLVIALFLGLLIPATVGEIRVTLQTLPTRDQVQATLNDLAVRARSLPPPVQDFIRNSMEQQYVTVQQHILLYLQRLLNTTLAGALSLASAISFLLGFLVLPTWLLSVLGDQKKAVRAMRRTLPSWLAGDFWAVVRIVDRAFGVILRGQLLRAVAITVLTWLGLALIERLGLAQFQYKLLLAMWLGFFSLIPNIGLLIGAVPLVAAGLFRSPHLGAIMVILVLIVQQIESRFVSSRIESRVVDIHPAILVPALVAISQFGIFWVFIASPLLVVIRDLWRYAYGRVSYPPAPAGVLPTGESVLERAQEPLRRRSPAPRLARPTGQVVPQPARAVRPTSRPGS